MRYVERTPFADDTSISYMKHPAQAQSRDKWDFWVFNLNCQGYVQGEKTWRNLYVLGYLDANRVTPDLKINLSTGATYNESGFKVSNATITSITRSQFLSGLIVKSIDDHWSYGMSADLSASSYSNIDILAAVAPALEYDLFPYSQSTRRQLRVLYAVYYEYARYLEETLYDKRRENLGKEKLSLTYEVKERWGSISAACSGSHFFHDIRKNRLTVVCELSLNLVRGFSLTLSGNAAMIHDLIATAKGQASSEDILLRRRQLDTQYSYYVSFGLRYTFGSIYSNVVNPRFGD